LKLVSTFAARGTWHHGLRRLQLPMSVELDGYGTFDVREEQLPEGAVSIISGEVPHDLLITGEREVDPALLVTMEDIFSPSGSGDGAKVLDTSVADTDRLIEGVHFIVGSISFATGVALDVMTAFGEEFPHEFVPETDADRERLEELGTPWARIPLAATNGVEVFADALVDESFVTALASRQIVGVYADALGDLSPPARFFSLWRTLEFAFQARNEKDLIPLILGYPEVSGMGFDLKELKDLRNLRGRLGHAVSSNGLGEILDTNTVAIHLLGRLWSLVDWIVLSKQGPGKDARCDPLAKLQAFIDRDGRVRMVGEGPPPWEWLENWSGMSPRFRH
jgi:hypothetical protein